MKFKLVDNKTGKVIKVGDTVRYTRTREVNFVVKIGPENGVALHDGESEMGSDCNEPSYIGCHYIDENGMRYDTYETANHAMVDPFKPGSIWEYRGPKGLYVKGKVSGTLVHNKGIWIVYFRNDTNNNSSVQGPIERFTKIKS